jgi:hypothetical protein
VAVLWLLVCVGCCLAYVLLFGLYTWLY